MVCQNLTKHETEQITLHVIQSALKKSSHRHEFNWQMIDSRLIDMNPSYTCGACHWSVHLLYIMVKQGSCSWNIQFQLKLIDLFKCICCPTYVVLQDTRQQQPGWPHDSFTNLKTEHFKTSSFFKVLFKSCLNYHAFSINLAGTKISCIVFIKITRESVDMIDIKQNVQSVVLQYYELFSPKNISHGKKKVKLQKLF